MAAAVGSPSASGPHKAFQYLSKAQLEELGVHFKAMDSNNDGVVDRAELVEALRKGFANVQPELVEEVATVLMEHADRNRDGTIDVDEFFRAFDNAEQAGALDMPKLVMQARAARRPSVAPASFQHLTPEQLAELTRTLLNWDSNGDGVVDFRECCDVLRASFGTADDSLVEEVATVLFDTCDRNHDGQLDMNEFFSAFDNADAAIDLPTLVKTQRSAKRAGAAPPSAFDSLSRDAVAELTADYNVVDSVSDGFVAASSLSTTLRQMFPTVGDALLSEVEETVLDTAERDDTGRLNITILLDSFAPPTVHGSPFVTRIRCKVIANQ